MEGNSNELTKEDFKTMTNDEFLKLSDKKLNGWSQLSGELEKGRALVPPSGHPMFALDLGLVKFRMPFSQKQKKKTPAAS